MPWGRSHSCPFPAKRDNQLVNDMGNSPDKSRFPRWGAGQWSAAAAVTGSITAVVALFIQGTGGTTTSSSPVRGPGSGTPRTASAERVAQRSFENFFDGNFGAVWDALHPADQQIISRDRYIACESSVSTASLQSMKITGRFGSPLHRPGIPQRAATNVAFLLHVEFPKGTAVRRRSQMLVRRNGQWKLLLYDSEWRAFRAGRCPFVPHVNKSRHAGGDQILK